MSIPSDGFRRSLPVLMSTAEETVTADQPIRLPHTRAEALRAWEEFRPRVTPAARRSTT